MTEGRRTSDGLFGLIEAGGTKVICAVASGPEDIRRRVRIETTTPEEVFAAAREFFVEATPTGRSLEGLGVATFGPVDVREAGAANYGRILQTPKPGWAGASWVEGLRGVVDGRIVVDTDVNGGALGEATWGAAKGLGTVVYVTVGTGIGGGVLVDGKPVHGVLHPEIGHMRVPREEGEREGFAGVCRFHGDCLEGLASGPAISARWGIEGEENAGRSRGVGTPGGVSRIDVCQSLAYVGSAADYPGGAG